MGDVIKLSERREALRRRGNTPRERSRAEFFFDLASPFTYLAAERVERAFEEVVWTPVSGVGAGAGQPEEHVERGRRAAEAEAALVRLPVVWPDRHPDPVPVAMRVASRAVELGRGAAFVLAASRLAFGGGYDLDEPEVLAEAAAAAGVPHQDYVDAVTDLRRDEAIAEAGRRLVGVGADRIPALRVRRALYWGEGRVDEALATVRLDRAMHR